MLEYFIQGRRIRTSLLLGFVIFILLPVIGLGSFSFFQGKKVLEQSVFNTLTYLTEAQENSINNWVNSRKTFITGLAENKKIQTMEPEQAVGVLSESLKMDINFLSLILVDADGKIKVDPLSKEQSFSVSVADREYFQQAITGKTSVSEVIIGRNSGKPVITVATPVKKREEIIGVLVGVVSIDVITSLVQQNFPGNKSESYLVNDKGLMMSESKFTRQLMQKRMVELNSSLGLKIENEPAQKISRGQSGMGIYPNYLGTKVFGVYSWIPEIKMGLVVEKEYYNALLEIGLKTYYSIAVVSILIFSLFISFAVIYSKRLTQPLEHLASEVNKIADGEFRSIINIRSNKEVEDLTSKINHMSSNLFNKTNQLNELISKLEDSKTALNKEKNKLAKISITDELTGLYNRRFVNNQLKKIISSTNNLGTNLSLMILDLDHFKKVNDTYGHGTGDVVLKEFSQLLKQYSRDTDVVGRFGGEEFVIVVHDVGQEKAKEIAERIRKTIENFTFDASNNKLNVTVSIGVASVKLSPNNSYNNVVENLLKVADECLYKAKESGRNKVSASAIGPT